jgi:hypothetical protein
MHPRHEATPGRAECLRLAMLLLLARRTKRLAEQLRLELKGER